MIVNSVKRRLGFALVIAAAAVGTTLVTGNSIAVIVAVAMVVLGAVLTGRSGQSPNSDRRRRGSGEPFSVTYRWRGNKVPDLKDLSQALTCEGLKLSVESQCSDEVALGGGSQFWTRLLGGYFVDPTRLPIRVKLKAIGAMGSVSPVLELEVHDRLGVGVRDEALGDRYEQAAANIRSAVEAWMLRTGGFEADSFRHAFD